MSKIKREAIDSNAAEGDDEHDEITTERRVMSPAHYVFKIESFSLLSKHDINMYETNEFNVGCVVLSDWIHGLGDLDESSVSGYPSKDVVKLTTETLHAYKLLEPGVLSLCRRLILYPNGDKSKKGEDHVSLYLALSEANPLKVGWEINATVRFFVFDQIHDEYLLREGKDRRFHTMKSKWGIPRFMPLKTFINPSNGYLVDDTCVFGVEVFVAKSLGLGECLTLKASPESFSHEWKMSNFSTLVNDCYSEVFTAGNHNWNLHLHPRGDGRNREKNLSIFLCLADSGDQKVKATFTIWLKGKDGKKHEETGGTNWFNSAVKSWGWPSFLPLKTVQDYLVGDECVVEAEVEVLGTSKLKLLNRFACVVLYCFPLQIQSPKTVPSDLSLGQKIVEQLAP
ncbi:uncharacterized protein LOC115756270 [Rhodamnia argentea]|uniref:Uncharacterized protein LOC115756270 n=1 Tax=Rhodamnia argentea TaxID=178133 RepID=A0ABM3HMR0_9MYRT|nr:uncharacterized protein LOC115756270 [Rhodamnia argentea]